MSTSPKPLNRREFTKTTLLAGAVATAGALEAAGADAPQKRIRTGVIGCGSVSHSYLPVLTKCPYVEVVSLCDIRPERAKQAEKFKVANHYPHIDKMLAGEPFDFLVDLTDMQEHERLNRAGLEAGKHVWSEKPIANSLAAGQELLRTAISKKLRLWGAPITVQSPQFAFMAQELPRGARTRRGGTRRLRPRRAELVGVLLRKGRRQHARSGRLQSHVADRTTGSGQARHGDGQHRDADANDRRSRHD